MFTLVLLVMMYLKDLDFTKFSSHILLTQFSTSPLKQSPAFLKEYI